MAPFGKDKDAKVAAEFKKHGDEIMQKAREKELREKFRFLEPIKETGQRGQFIVGNQLVSVGFDRIQQEFFIVETKEDLF